MSTLYSNNSRYYYLETQHSVDNHYCRAFAGCMVGGRSEDICFSIIFVQIVSSQQSSTTNTRMQREG